MLERALIASSYLSAGDVAPRRGSGASPLELRERVALVGAAGWSGMGLCHVDVEAARERIGLAGIAALLAAHGLRQLELEVLRDWWTTGGRRTASDRVRGRLLEAADELGAYAVKVVAHNHGEPVDRDLLTAEFDRLATDARAAGTRVALEPMRSSDVIPTVEAAVEIVAAAGNPAGGLAIDSHHVWRGRTPYAALPEILPADRVFIVELSDGDRDFTGTHLDAEIDQRRMPGEGAFDVPAFVVAMHDAGYDGPWGVEVLSDAYRRLPAAEGLERAHASARRVLDEASERLAARAGSASRSG